MKKWICGLFVILLVAVYVHAAYAAAHVGVLHIPAHGISVALYNSNAQSVVDAQNSAACYWYQGYIVADHNNQAFANLPRVKVGDRAHIYKPNGQPIRLKCAFVANGRNTGRYLTVNGKSMYGKYDYLMYTCRKGMGWRNVVITGWEVVD